MADLTAPAQPPVPMMKHEQVDADGIKTVVEKTGDGGFSYVSGPVSPQDEEPEDDGMMSFYTDPIHPPASKGE